MRRMTHVGALPQGDQWSRYGNRGGDRNAENDSAEFIGATHG
jgi:hypothetical protein